MGGLRKSVKPNKCPCSSRSASSDSENRAYNCARALLFRGFDKFAAGGTSVQLPWELFKIMSIRNLGVFVSPDKSEEWLK